MITRTSLRHPATRARICLAMLGVIRQAKKRGSGVQLITPRNAGGALRLAVVFDPAQGGWHFLDSTGVDVGDHVRDALLDARRQHAVRCL